MSTRSWFTMTLAALGLLVTVSAVFGTWALIGSTNATDKLVDHITPALLNSQRLRTALLDQEAGVHGYVQSGRRDFLAPYEQGAATEREVVAALRRSPAGADVLARLDEVERRAGLWRGGYAAPMIEAVQTRGPGMVTPAEAQRGKVLFDHMRAALAEQDRSLAREQAAATGELARARFWRDLIFAAILVMFLLTLVAVTVLLRYAVLRPLDRLGSVSRRVAGGEFDLAIDAGGPKDVAELAADVDAMRRRISSELAVSREAQRLLQEQAEELRRSNAELEQFAYVASHDLQEPVRKVTAFCQLLQRRYAGRLDERADEYIAFAVDGAKRMQTLISELLAFSRVGRTQAEQHLPVPLDQPLERALANLSTMLDENGAVVERPELPEVVGDPHLLTMLWQNLIGNAVKFRAPERLPEVTITARRDGDFWELSVADNGIGVEPRFADKIFVIFQRLHNRDDYDGTGIGLALCKKIVEYHGGGIRLDTEVTRGSRFIFTLPAAGAGPRPHEAALPASPAPAALPPPAGPVS
ncbi:ATP-binding protein [Sphaerisporangium sp. TRM90804]|uniref:sensor histidine kinase n=1 Tax=Sphaerisporangium sp. TRM90804 TaxID=3031113 RepID=UPI00244A8F6F|nr:ATP-binding protein [Sphaerisporangium sp. TRM90804]MDH2426253.1 ATP-binding protein [Sphaerisporangium sp. TRM90804]